MKGKAGNGKKLSRLFLLLAGLTLMYLYTIASAQPEQKSQAPTQEQSVTAVEAVSERHSGPAMAALLERVRQRMAQDSTEYVVYISFPGTTRDAEVSWQSKSMRSASLIKVFILVTAMDLEKAGKLQDNQLLTLREEDKVGGAGSLCGRSAGTQLTLHDVLFHMITESDNTATNMVIDLVGMDTVNAYIQREGYGDTSLQRHMMDMAAVQAGRENYTSVQDLGKFFTRLYKRQCVGGSYDDEMLDFLLQQTDKECFPSVLTNRQIAYKTGELVGLYDDAGIIYGASSDYILCIMDENMAGREQTLQTMRDTASLVDAAAEEE